MVDAKLIIPPDRIASRVSELGSMITADFAGKSPVLLAVLTGAMWFVADLARAIRIDADVDFLMLNRFGEGGRIRIATDSSIPLDGRDVILVEDVVDTGLSLTVLSRLLSQRNLASLTIATLLDKRTRRLVDVDLQYRGFEVGDEYLIGYGLDHRGRYRNLAGIWAIMDMEVAEHQPHRLDACVFG